MDWLRAKRRNWPVLVGGRVRLMALQRSDAARWNELRLDDEHAFRAVEPRWEKDALTRAGFLRRLVHYQREAREGRGFTFGVYTGPDDLLVGAIRLYNIQMGARCVGTIGFWLGRSARGRGLMQEAVSLVLDFAFAELALNRVEATCTLNNNASRRTLEACGFRHEGIGREWLALDGHWRDHHLFAILAGD